MKHKEIYNKLSSSYDELLLESVYEFQKNYKQIYPKEKCDYTLFYPSFGIKPNEKCDFLIVGQAVNGGDTMFKAHKSYKMDLVEKSIYNYNKFFEQENEKHTPLDLVNVTWTKSLLKEHRENVMKAKFYGEAHYFYYRSFFWKLAYRLISDYYGFERDSNWDWSTKMVWSNLYKIAPYDGGNPNDEEKRCQKEYSIKLFQKELDELKPKYCIIPTNAKWWLPFKEVIKTKPIIIPEHLNEIELIEKYNDTLIIVTTRRPRANSDDYVKQILEVIKNDFNPLS